MKLWHNNEIKRLTIILTITLIISLLLSLFISKIIIDSYQSYFLNYNARVLNIVTKEYPDLDEKIIEEILNPQIITESDLKYLEKYGINKETLLKSIKPVKDQYYYVLMTEIILTLIIVFSFVIIILHFLSKF